MADENKTMESVEENRRRIEELEHLLDQAQQDLSHYREHCEAVTRQRDELVECIKTITDAKEALENATFWKMTRPLREASTFFKRIAGVDQIDAEQVSWSSWRISDAERKSQEKQKFPEEVSFGIVIFLENAGGKHLKQMIQSVLQQTFGNWQLYLIGNGVYDSADVKKTCHQYVSKDKRVHYCERSDGESQKLLKTAYICTGRMSDCFHPAALYECAKAIVEKEADIIYSDDIFFERNPLYAKEPRYKPAFSPDLLRSCNYIGPFIAFRRDFLSCIGDWQTDFIKSGGYNLAFLLSELNKKIVRIPGVLYFIRKTKADGGGDSVCQAELQALREHLVRKALVGTVEPGRMPGTYRVHYEIRRRPLVSILIPNRNQTKSLQICIDSILQKTTYPDYEIIVIENNSTDADIFQYYQKLEEDARIRVIRWEKEFNYSAINNFGVDYARGEYLIFLNNDIEIISEDWIQEMLMFAQRKDVGAVGAKLYYPDDTIQHAGVIIGIGGVAGHSHKYYNRDSTGYCNRLIIAQNYSAVTAACMMMRTEVYKQLGGFDELYPVAFNDVDLCVRVRKQGYLIVYTPYAEAYHYESKSRGQEDTREKQLRAMMERNRFRNQWARELRRGDEYYNPNLTIDREDFSLRKYDKNSSDCIDIKEE